MTSSTPPIITKTIPILLSHRWSEIQRLCLLGVYLVTENSGYYYGDYRAVDDLTRRPIESWKPRIGGDHYASRCFRLQDEIAWDNACASLTSKCAIRICKSDLHEQLQYLLHGLERISDSNYTPMVERNAEKKFHPNIHFTTEANFLAIGMCIAVYAPALPDRPREPHLHLSSRRQVDFEGLAAVLNRCPAFPEQNIDAAQVKRCIEDIWMILEQEGDPISLLSPPSIEKRPSSEELTSVRSKQMKLG